jgi:hypothetical protein
MFISKKISLEFFICCIALIVSAQQYPQGYFRNPLDIPIELAGNFGECRPNHFHSGIDIKTQGKENLKVYAVADGYISRIKMERGGFGHALYITHPNGYTTLYAHLNNFIPAVQKYTRDRQYEKENWEIDIQLKPSQFPIKKGQQIAWSGNTGGSTAPHLHFEIRSTETEHPLNPQLFGFSITDNIPPKPTQLAIYDLTKSIYEQKPQILALSNKGDYVPATKTIQVNSPIVGVGLNVFDYMNGSTNTLAFYTAEVYMDDLPKGRILLDDIGYDVTRYLHAYADIKTRKATGNWVQLLFRLPGNNLKHLYQNFDQYGMDIFDGKLHNIRIELKDVYDNLSTVSFGVQYTPPAIPFSCDEQLMKPGETSSFEHPNIKFKLNEDALYDDVCFRFSTSKDINSLSDKYTLHESGVPIHSYFLLYIKPNKPVPFELRDKLAMIYSDGNDENGRAAKYDTERWYTAKVRNFGTYRLVADTVAPTIKNLQQGNDLSKAKSMSFTATDNITSVKEFRAELDGKWLCFEQRGSTYFYIFDEHCSKGKHTLVVTAKDENDNIRTLKYSFTR